jgi:hypothetical protein
MKRYPSLMKAHEKRPKLYAYCTGCHKIYIDDVPLIGSIACPNQKHEHQFIWAVHRGLSQAEIKMIEKTPQSESLYPTLKKRQH